ncbi:MAG: hypothetical protein RR135_01425 [Oscillospiraceae bacterium]
MRLSETELLCFQEEPLKALTALWDGGRFPHALLLEGSVGSGRKTLAMYAVALLLCRGEHPPCGACLSCRKLVSGNHPDLTVLETQNKSKTLSVDQIRALRSDTFLAPHESARRVFLIPEAHTMTAQAQNALLKSLEEPPQGIFFVMTTLSRGGLLETVRSRATVIAMRELTAVQLREVLARLRPEIDGPRLTLVSESATTVGEALALLEDGTTEQRMADAKRVLTLVAARERYDLMQLLSGYEKDREAFVSLLSAVKSACASQMRTMQGLGSLQCIQIVAIIEDTLIAARQNVGLPLLSAVFAGRLTAL